MKKFVKGLLVSGFAVALLAGCSNKSKCSSSECPQPQPAPVKEEWTAFEAKMFELTEIGELPFDYELSLEDLDDTGILYATSASEVSEDDVDTYADKLLESELYSEYDAGTSDGLTIDASMLGFDQDAQMYQFYRPYQDKETSFFADVVTIGLDEDSHLRVAAVSAYLPLYAYAGPGLSNGTGIYTLKFTHPQYGVIDFYNMYYGEIVASTTGGNFSQTVPTARAAHPEIVTDTTCGAFANSAVMAPYFYGNTESDLFQADYSIFYIKALDDETGPESYTASEFESVLDQAKDYMAEETYPYAPEQDWDWGYVDKEGEDPTKGVWFDYLDLAGFSITVTYSLEEVSLGGQATNVIVAEFEPSEFELPVRGREMASALGESISYEAQYVSDYEPSYFISQGLLGEVTEEYDAEAAMLDIDLALYESEYVGVDQLDNWVQTAATSYQEPLTFNDQYNVRGAVVLGQYTPAGSDKTYWTFTVQLTEKSKDDFAAQVNSALYSGVIAAYSGGAITAPEANAFLAVRDLVIAAESSVEVDYLANLTMGLFAEALGVEDTLEEVDRLVEEDFDSIAQGAQILTLIKRYTSYVNQDVAAPTTFGFSDLYDDLSSLRQYLNLGLSRIRAAATAALDLSAVLAEAGIIEDNYDAEDWGFIETAVAAFNFNDCYSFDECDEKVSAFVEKLSKDYKVWKVKYQDLMNALQAEYANRQEEYEASNWTSLQGILSTGATDVAAAIAADNKVDAIAAYETARDDAAAIPTKLDTYKEAQADEFENFFNTNYDNSDYFADDWSNESNTGVFDIYSQAVPGIDTATSEEAVDAVIAAAKEFMAAVKTAEDRKDDGKAELDTYVAGLDQEKYEAHKTAVDAAVAEAKNDIDSASDKAAIDSIIASAKETIEGILNS